MPHYKKSTKWPVFLAAMLSLFLLSCAPDYTQNDFSTYFGLDSFDLTIEDVVKRERDYYGVSTYDRMDLNPPYGIRLSFPAQPKENEDWRAYCFDSQTMELVHIDYYCAKSQYAKLKNMFQNERETRDQEPYWVGYIGDQKMVLMASSKWDEPWSMQLYRK